MQLVYIFVFGVDRTQWTAGAGPEFTDSHSTTNSSASSRTYHNVANTPSDNYYQEPLDLSLIHI